MDFGYAADFSVKIDPQKRSSLIETMNDLRLINDEFYYFFTTNERQSSTTLHININTQVSLSFADQLEEFITSDLHKAAKSTVLITEVCDGDENVFTIGPDAKDCISNYRLEEIRYHLKSLTYKERQIVKQWAINPS